MSKPANRLLLLMIAVSILAALLFGLRSYGSYLLLRSAHDAGRPQVSSLRAWMTLEHVAATYRLPAEVLIAKLKLPPDTDRRDSLKTIADRRGIARFALVQETQRAIGSVAPAVAAEKADSAAGGFGDAVMTAVLNYGYAALAVTFLLGAIGAPLPTGLVAVLAGSLAGAGHLKWSWLAALTVAASLAGDALAYLIGRLVGENVFSRYGPWIGYSSRRRDRVKALFARFGGLTVLVSRTLASHLSSIASVLAGVSHYPWFGFALFSVAGRVVWTFAYLGLGFAIGNDVEAASQFLANVSGLVLALALLVAALVYRVAAPRRPPGLGVA
jgi:membrane protein DedA with SNARE-associated domain